MQEAARRAVVVVLIAAVGLAISLVIENVHRQLDADVTYASFCNVNSAVNCDVVLTSAYARLAGVSVAVLSALYYAALLFGGVVVARSRSVARRASWATMILAAACVGLAFSLYLAVVSVVVLETICLLCSGLYVVAVGMLVASWWLRLGTMRLDRKGAEARARQERWMWGAAGVAVALLVATVAIQLVAGGVPSSAAEIEAERPDFYRWYLAQPVTSVAADVGNVRGDADASVTIVEFSDFGCGHCAAFDRNIGDILRGGDADVRLIFRHFPLDSACNPAISGSTNFNRCLAAVAAECAAEQDRFWQYARILFENQPQFAPADLQSYAAEADLDVGTFEACLQGEEARARVERDAKAGAALGIQSTPTVFINGRRIEGDLGADLRTALVLARAVK